MIKWIMAFVGVALIAGAAENETPVEQVALEAEKSEKTPAPVTLVSCSAQILSKARQVQVQIRGNNKADQELTELLAWKKQLTKLRLCSTAIFAQEIAALQDSPNADDNIQRMERQRQDLISRCNELERLLGQIEQNRDLPLLSEKINNLIIFLEPPEQQIQTETSRGAAAVKGKGSEPSETGEQQKKQDSDVVSAAVNEQK